MDDNSEQKKSRLTALLERGSTLITRDDSVRQGEDGLLLDRRSYLAVAGVTTAALAGCASRDSGETVRPVSAFGYGGGEVLRQTSSLSVSESEPNEREGNANAIGLGATVTGTLTVSDSDWYTVDFSAGNEITVEFSRDAPTGVTAIILYGPDGTYSNLRYITTDDPVSMTQMAETSGTHFIQVVDTQNSDGGYTMTVSDGTMTTPTETATPEATETATPVVTETRTVTSTATPAEDDYGEQGYGDYGYGGIAT